MRGGKRPLSVERLENAFHPATEITLVRFCVPVKRLQVRSPLTKVRPGRFIPFGGPGAPLACPYRYCEQQRTPDPRAYLRRSGVFPASPGAGDGTLARQARCFKDRCRVGAARGRQRCAKAGVREQSRECKRFLTLSPATP